MKSRGGKKVYCMITVLHSYKRFRGFLHFKSSKNISMRLQSGYCLGCSIQGQLQIKLKFQTHLILNISFIAESMTASCPVAVRPRQSPKHNLSTTLQRPQEILLLKITPSLICMSRAHYVKHVASVSVFTGKL